MRLRFSESDINDLANDYTEYQESAGVHHREIEDRVIEFRDKIQERGYLIKNELHKVSDWISSVYGESTADRTSENADTFIEVNTRQAFTSTDDWEKLQYLMELQGVGQTTASAILHLYDNRQYPIFSQRSRWSVGLERGKNLSYHLWLEYVAFCRDIVNRNGVKMRTLDRALWFYSYNNSARNYHEV